jgi:hypothetical protein
MSKSRDAIEAQRTALSAVSIGTSVQAYDADTAKLDVEQTYTAAQTFGTVAVTGNVDGRDVSVDGTKLDGIAASANNYSHPSNHAISVVTGLQSALDGKTTESYVNTAVSNLVDSSPATLNTLNELAAALGDDPNYATTTANAIGTKLPLAGGTMTGDISHGDNVKAKFGAGDDLQIYHTGSHTFVDDAGTGNLYIRSNSVVLGKYTGEYGLSCTADGSTDLYYDNALKLATTATGVDVTGSVGVNSSSGATYPTLGTASGSLGLSVNSLHGMYLGVDGSSGNGWLQAMREDGTGTSYNMVLQPSGGNVGIGTATFGATYDKLAVAGGINLQDDYAGKLEIGRYSSGVPNSYIKLGANSNSLRFTNKNDSVDLLTIENGGNVGIGTSSPTSGFKLEVTGDARFGDVVGDDAVELGWSAGGSVGFIQAYDRGASAFRPLNLNGAMTLDSSGSVGIGTSSPSALIDAVTNTNDYVAKFIQSNTSNGDGVQIIVGSTASADYALTVRSDAGNTSGLAVKADGKVGIGTFVPSKPLDVTGDIRTSTGILFGTDTAAANTLDDYEEGTWTPVVTGGTSSPSSVTYHTPPSGTYTKTGRVVTIAFYLHINTVTGGSGSFQLNGMPFTAITPSGGFSGAISLYQVASSSYSDPVLQVGSGSIGILCASGANGSFSQVGWGRAPLSVFATGSAMSGTVTYFV